MFEEKYVHIVWSDELREKMCFVADNIAALKDAVERNSPGFRDFVAPSDSDTHPFCDNSNLSWQFCYYDPDYTEKLALKRRGMTFKLGDKVRTQSGIEAIIIAINPDGDQRVYCAAGSWYSADKLEAI